MTGRRTTLRRALIVAALIAGGVLLFVFARLNHQQATVDLFSFEQLEVPLWGIVLFCLALGIVIDRMLTLRRRMKAYHAHHQALVRIAELEKAAVVPAGTPRVEGKSAAHAGRAATDSFKPVTQGDKDTEQQMEPHEPHEPHEPPEPVAEQDPDEVARMAEKLAEQGQIDAARKGFKRSLRLEPDLLRAHLGLARLDQDEGKQGKARHHWLHALKSNPRLAPLLLPRIRSTYGEASDHDEEQYDELLVELAGDPILDVWVRLEQVDRHYQRNELEPCLKSLEALLKDHPKSVEAHEAYLNLLGELNDQKRIQQAVEQLVDLAAEGIERFQCSHCGLTQAVPFLTCPRCHSLGTLSERP